MERRDFFKLFGAGATIVPLIGGVPEVAVPAKLIEVPKIEPVQYPALETKGIPLASHDPCAITVTITTPDGKTYRMSAKTFVAKVDVSSIPYGWGDVHQMIVPCHNVSWNMEGVFTGELEGFQS
jgi:hypothetical protein